MGEADVMEGRGKGGREIREGKKKLGRGKGDNWLEEKRKGRKKYGRGREK